MALQMFPLKAPLHTCLPASLTEWTVPMTATSAPSCLLVSVGGVASANAAWLSEYWGAPEWGVVEL